MPDQNLTTEEFRVEVNNAEASCHDYHGYRFKVSTSHGYLTTLMMDDGGCWQTEEESLLEKNFIEAIRKPIET